MVKFKRLFISFVLISLFIASPVFAVDTHRIWYASSLTGGGTGALDGVVSGVSIGPYDAAIVVDSNLMVSIYTATNTTNAENAPYVIRPDDVAGGTTSWELVSITGTTTYNFEAVVADKIISGASLFVGSASGTTLTGTELGTVLYNNLTTSQIWRLPSISGTSVQYVKVVDGAAGGGVTIVPTDSEPFMASGLSGGSYFALPPGNPFKKATLYGIKTGSTAYWLVEYESGWVAGD